MEEELNSGRMYSLEYLRKNDVNLGKFILDLDGGFSMRKLKKLYLHNQKIMKQDQADSHQRYLEKTGQAEVIAVEEGEDGAEAPPVP